MIRQTPSIKALAICVMAATVTLSQEPGPLQQRLGEIKQSIADNQAQLKQYAWTETIEVSLKGDVKKRDQADCMYGPDGKVQKTPIGAPPSAPASKGRKGIKGRIIANKIEEMKEYMDRVGSLVRRYIPPNPQSMQAAFQSGKAVLDAETASLVFTDYVKSGDEVRITFDPETKKIKLFSVATYLDEPKDAVTVNARFSRLADGTNFMEESVLDAKGKEIKIKTTNSGHRKAGG